jgi:hypothetical protein
MNQTHWQSRWRLLVPCAAVLACLLASPAWGATVVSTAPDTTVYLGQDCNALEDPPIGSTLNGFRVMEWRDADYLGPGNYKDWNAVATGLVDGDANEVWIRADNGDLIVTQSTLTGRAVSVHVAGDSNDGLAEILVDGASKATLDMYTAGPGADCVQVVVRGLPLVLHTIEVVGTGDGSGGTGVNDVAVKGAAVEGPPIPTLSGWGMMLLVLVLATAGTLMLRRQRRSAMPT